MNPAPVIAFKLVYFVVVFHGNMIFDVNTPHNPPSIAPVAYTSLCILLPNATDRTFEVQSQDIPNPAMAIPGQNSDAMK
jgi:hypothetical protein